MHLKLGPDDVVVAGAAAVVVDVWTPSFMIFMKLFVKSNFSDLAITADGGGTVNYLDL